MKQAFCFQHEKINVVGNENYLLKEMIFNTTNQAASNIPAKITLQTLKKKDPQGSKDIREAMNEYIFPHVKFIKKETLMTIAPKSIGATICKHIGVPEKDWVSFWSTRYLIAYNEFSNHKTRFTRYVKDSFESSEFKCITNISTVI